MKKVKQKKPFRTPRLYRLDASRNGLTDCSGPGDGNSGGNSCIDTGPLATANCEFAGNTAFLSCVAPGGFTG